MSNIYGIDISKHQGNIDFDAIKKNNKFVIIRAGYSYTKDPKFDEYYAKAKAKGLGVGAYWYSYALTPQTAVKEAEYMLSVIKGKQFDYPIYFDMEDADGYKAKHGMPTNAVLCDMCKAFCEHMEKHGIYVGVYASESWFNNQLKGLSKDYDRWVAHWGGDTGKLTTKKTAYRMHQFTSRYPLDGKLVDRNVCYGYDYPAVIKGAGLNGYAKPPVKPAHKVGDTIRIKKGAKDANTGSTYASWVYGKPYTIININSTHVVFGIKGVVTGKTLCVNIV